MAMTDVQKYGEVLKALGEALARKDSDIICNNWQIDELKGKLAAAEQQRDDANKRWSSAAEQLEEATTGQVSATACLLEINVALMECVDIEKRAIVDVERLVALQSSIKNVLLHANVEGGAA